jgi:hypothetical protein
MRAVSRSDAPRDHLWINRRGEQASGAARRLDATCRRRDAGALAQLAMPYIRKASSRGNPEYPRLRKSVNRDGHATIRRRPNDLRVRGMPARNDAARKIATDWNSQSRARLQMPALPVHCHNGRLRQRLANWRGLPGVGGPALAAVDGLFAPRRMSLRTMSVGTFFRS